MTIQELINCTPDEFWAWIARTSPYKPVKAEKPDKWLEVEKRKAATRTADTEHIQLHDNF